MPVRGIGGVPGLVSESVLVTSEGWEISRAHVFLVPKSHRCSKGMSKVFRLRYEARSSTIRVSKIPLQGSARGVPVPPNSHF